MLKELEDTVQEVRQLLEKDKSWIQRYNDYAEEIKINLNIIKSKKEMFHEWSPLYLYMNVSEATRQMGFNLRYQGQSVADIKVDNKVLISSKKYDANNKKHFGCNINLNDTEWSSSESTQFRKHFSMNPQRSNEASSKNNEHRIESKLLTEFSKSSSENKIILNIQPVKLANIARFQMPVPISASGKTFEICKNAKDGHIDILARIGKGKSTKLCIMELKDENKKKEPASKVLKQGLAYATFIRELLRSSGGNNWWNIFGFKGNVPDQLELLVACVMPSINTNDESFGNTVININNTKDTFRLHYLYFEENNDSFSSFETSL